MNDPLQHNWNVDIAEAKVIQEQLHHQVITEDDLGPVHLVAGVDVGFEEDGTVTRAAVAVLTLADLQVVESAVVRQPTTFPYVPGFLSFREIPALLAALAQLKTAPDLVLCDGQGIAHPRGLGIASHLGVLTDMPTIGVGKSRLVGRHEPVGIEKGSRQPLWYKKKIVGTVLRTRTNTKPLYISLGHRVSLETAVHYTLLCTPKYRLPETTRQAHRLASG